VTEAIAAMKLTNGLIEAHAAMKRKQTNMTCIYARTMQTIMFELVACLPAHSDGDKTLALHQPFYLLLH
jgi:hypothetical protein